MSRRVALALVVLLAGGCRQVFGLDTPQLAADAATTATDDGPPADTVGSDGGPTYHASAVRFDGQTYLSYGKLGGATDTPRGTFSVWLHFNAADGQQQLIVAAQVVAAGGIVRQASNHVEFILPACTGATMLDMSSVGTYTTASGWVHVLASWDLSLGRAQLYINDVADRAPTATINNGNICDSAPTWGIGGLSSASLTADVADLYASLDTSLDLDVAANRRLFITADHKPVSPGTRCSAPLIGIIPIGCFIGSPSTWATNKGTGGGFTTHGLLIAAPTSPSD